jgi:probable rRNA maturation factor
MTTYQIDVLQNVKVESSVVGMLRTAVNQTLRHENIQSPAAISLLLTDDEQLHQLNKAFRGIDRPTDVLSFPAPKLPPEVATAEPPYLGDIAISLPMAQRQATEGSHSLQDELLLLTIHGTLHLLGYDHEDTAAKQAMWQAQNAILARLGAEITSPE